MQWPFTSAPAISRHSEGGRSKRTQDKHKVMSISIFYICTRALHSFLSIVEQPPTPSVHLWKRCRQRGMVRSHRSVMLMVGGSKFDEQCWLNIYTSQCHALRGESLHSCVLGTLQGMLRQTSLVEINVFKTSSIQWVCKRNNISSKEKKHRTLEHVSKNCNNRKFKRSQRNII